MKKVLYFLPAIIFLIFYVFAFIIADLEPIAYVFCALLILAGAVLSSDKWWGSIVGILVGVWLAVLDITTTGAVIRQWPIGFAVAVYFIVCGYLSFRKNK